MSLPEDKGEYGDTRSSRIYTGLVEGNQIMSNTYGIHTFVYNSTKWKEEGVFIDG